MRPQIHLHNKQLMDTHLLFVGVCNHKNQLLNGRVGFNVEETKSKKGLLLLPIGTIFFPLN